MTTKTAPKKSRKGLYKTDWVRQPDHPTPCPNCGEPIKSSGGFRPKAETTQALAWLAEDPSRTIYKAAKKFGVQQSTILRALPRREQKCRICGYVVGASDGDLV
jgi:hypothetical protein